LKKNKRTQFSFKLQQDAPEGGIVKGKNINVPSGIGKDAYPDIKVPVKVEHTRTTGYGGGGGGGNKKMDIPPQNNRPPQNQQPRRVPVPQQTDEDDDGGQAPPPRRTGPPPRGRLPRQTNDDDDDNGGGQAPPPRRTGRLPMPGMGGPPRMPIPPM